MGDENPRIMYGVIITVYVDREATTVRSFRRRQKNEWESFIERTWKREIGKTRGYDRRASLLAYLRQMRAESLAGESKRDDGESDGKSEQAKPKVTFSYFSWHNVSFYSLIGPNMGYDLRLYKD